MRDRSGKIILIKQTENRSTSSIKDYQLQMNNWSRSSISVCAANGFTLNSNGKQKILNGVSSMPSLGTNGSPYVFLHNNCNSRMLTIKLPSITSLSILRAKVTLLFLFQLYC